MKNFNSHVVVVKSIKNKKGRYHSNNNQDEHNIIQTLEKVHSKKVNGSNFRWDNV